MVDHAVDVRLQVSLVLGILIREVLLQVQHLLLLRRREAHLLLEELLVDGLQVLNLLLGRHVLHVVK